MATLINESFEGVGYEDPGFLWENEGVGCTVDEDNTDISPPSGFGSNVLKSVSASSGYRASALWDLGADQLVVYYRFYVYIADYPIPGGGPYSKEIFVSVDADLGWGALCHVNRTDAQFKLIFSTIGGGDPSGNSWQSVNINEDTWYRVEYKHDITGDSWEWRLDGGTEDSGDFNGIEDSDGSRRIICGWEQASTQNVGTIYIDGVAASDVGWLDAEEENYFLVPEQVFV